MASAMDGECGAPSLWLLQHLEILTTLLGRSKLPSEEDMNADEVRRFKKSNSFGC